MNIEEAGAETMYRNGFVQKKVTTSIRNEKDLKMLAKSIEQINRKDAIILPEGTDVENLNPGTTEFSEFHNIFMKLLAIRLGIPQPLLTMDGTSTNKATLDSQKQDMFDDFAADELIVKKTIEDQIFEPACKLLFGEDFKDIPFFEFNAPLEDENSKADVFMKESQSIVNLANASKYLAEAGKSEETDMIMEYMKRFLKNKMIDKNDFGDSNEPSSSNYVDSIL